MVSVFIDSYIMPSILEKYFLHFRIFLYFNLFFLVFLLFFCVIFYYLSKIGNFQVFFRSNSVFKFLKLFLFYGFVLAFFFHIIFFFFYYQFIYKFYSFSIMSMYMFIPTYEIFFNYDFFYFLPVLKCVKFYLSIDFFGIILLTLAYVVGFISILALDTRLYWKNIKYFFSFNVFLIIVFLYVSVTNLVLFFLMYECLLIPSFFFVYFVSPSRRAIQASIYFVIWTQVGSFLVLCAVSYILSVSSCSDFFSLRSFKFTNDEVWVLYILLFFGFGFKVPIWPFHYWLTKTHVEAASGFSIYLSGFLVKSALYGFYKMTTLLNGDFNTSFFIVICMIGVIDSSLKMWGQTDLKKLVAYGTIQEMNLIYLLFCWGDTNAIIGGILFSVTHAFLSALMFFVVDCIYRRYHTRSIVEINGLLHLTPNLGLAILFMCIFFSGLPGTIKFIVEFYVFSGFLEVSPFSCFFLMAIANVFGLIGFSKCWFNVVFGMFRKNMSTIPLDLTTKEIYIIMFCFIVLFFFSFFFNF